MNRKREKARDTHSISKWKEELQDHEARQCQQFGKRELESTHSTTSSSKSGCETDTVRDQTMSSAKRRRILHTLGDGDATNTGVMNVEEKYDMTASPTENQEKEIGGEQKGRSIFDAFTHVHNGSETDSQRSMTLKAQHEVTSLSPVTRNRILESMHGVLSDEEDHHEDRGYRQPPGRANKSEEQRSRREARRNTEFGQEKHSRMELLSTEIKILKTATGRRVDSSRDVVEGIQIDYEIGQARGEGRYATSVKEQEFPQQRQQQNLRERGSFIREKLDELDDAISDIDQKVAYDEAIQVDDGYVKDRKFRLVFLRADSFDVRKAAQRLVAFMDEKLRRFGPHALTRQLTIDDLSAVAKSMVIKKGAVQLLPTRDTSGRAILVAYYHVSQVRDELRKDPKSLVSCDTNYQKISFLFSLAFHLMGMIPFSESNYARAMPYSISCHPWPKTRKLNVVVLSPLA